MRAALAALTLISSAACLAAEDAFLALPIDCTLGETCFIEDYMDRDPTEGLRDHACGLKTRDDHSGTDIALLSFEAMDAGVSVLAAADGTVEAVRDGMADVAATPETRTEILGRECGNAVRVSHDNGLETLYCHLKRGSVAVTPGEALRRGAVLGQVGLSGLTNYPHVHLSVLKDGERVDPFHPDPIESCDGPAGPTLWLDPPVYHQAGIFTAAFSTAVPGFDAVQTGAARVQTAEPGDALVLYGHLFHAQDGDILRHEAQGPDGVVFSHSAILQDAQINMFRAFGKRAPDGGWPRGAYRGRVILERDGEVVALRHADIVVK